MKIRTSIIGASGYTGIELVRLLNSHPHVELKYLVSETYQGQEIAQIFPHLAKLINTNFSSPGVMQIARDSDVVFLALPHTKSILFAKDLLSLGCKVVDLSADLRLNEGAIYEKWYSHPAPSQELLKQAVYGLPEIGLCTQISKSNLVANPGCYPTATILGLAPIISRQYLDLVNMPLIIDAKSGVSGAGRSLNLNTHFCEAMNNFSAYQVGGIHRHIPEIEQELTKLAKEPITIQFTPHLVPMPRGMMVTIYCKLKIKLNNIAEIAKIYTEYYQDSYFIRINTSEPRPGVKAVTGSNFCNIYLYLDKRTNCLSVISLIDNLLKGASGQAVQNMNLMYQLPEWAGLQATGTYP